MRLALRRVLGIGVALCILALPLLIDSSRVAAVNYGSGNYGDCVYGGELGNDALSFTVNTSSVSLSPNISPNATSVGTATFDVELGCSDFGYIVTIDGQSLSNGSHTISNLSTATASTAGSEQYGINLMDNTTPNVGTGASGGIGQAASGYNTADLFKYVSGNTIAEAITYSTQTSYTISFIVNAAAATPSGTYNTIHTLICTATF